MSLSLCNAFIDSPWKTSFFFLWEFFSVKTLFKSRYLKWGFYCNCSKRLKKLIALTSGVFQKKLSGLCVWSGSTMQRGSRREMNCINSNKLQETHCISESSLQLWFRGLSLKDHWNQGQICQQRLLEDGGPRPPMKVKLPHSGFFQRNNMNNNNNSTQQHLWTQKLNKSLASETEMILSLIIKHSHEHTIWGTICVRHFGHLERSSLATRQAGSPYMWVHRNYWPALPLSVFLSNIRFVFYG